MHTDKAIKEMLNIEDEASMNTFVHGIHPLAKLLVTVAFLAFTISYGKYDLAGVIFMCIYPFVVFSMSMVSIMHCFKRIWPVIPVFLLFGIFNVIFESNILFSIGNINITYGTASAIVLIFKGILAITGAYLLVSTTGMENICYALRVIHVPQIMVTQILLTYRYLTVFINQAGELFQAYTLRAPGQKGVNIKAWGPFLGQLLLRSADKAEAVYESMILRGYNGEFPLKRVNKSTFAGIIYAIIWISFFAFMRFGNLPSIIGKFVMRVM